MPVLSVAAGLLDEFPDGARSSFDRFLVGDLRLAHARSDLELAEHPVDENLEVEFPIPEIIVCEVSGSVLTRNVGSSSLSFSSASPSLSWSALSSARWPPPSPVRESASSRASRVLELAYRVAGARLPQTHHRGDVAGIDDLALFALVRVHLNEPAKTLFVTRIDVEVVLPSPRFRCTRGCR